MFLLYKGIYVCVRAVLLCRLGMVVRAVLSVAKRSRAGPARLEHFLELEQFSTARFQEVEAQIWTQGLHQHARVYCDSEGNI